MEVVLSGDCDSVLAYPYWKVVLAGDRAAVAEFPCESEGGEVLSLHEDLISLLRARDPGLEGLTDITAGWLTRRDDEAVLYLHLGAGGLSRLDPELIGCALSDWCDAAGIRRLTVADFSRRSRSADSARGDWWSLQ